MTPDDAAVFITHIGETLGFYKKPPVPFVQLSPVEVDMWWEALSEYDFQTIKKGTLFHRQNPDRGRFSPMPADLIAAIEERVRAAWPSANEAWAVALQAADERATIVWSEESERALAVAKPILDGGDGVAARMAFKDAYDRELQRALREVRPPVIKISLGHDMQGRIDVLERALSLGQITHTQVAPLLEGAQKALGTQAVAIAGLITGKTVMKTGDSPETDEEIEQRRQETSTRLQRLRELQSVIKSAPDYKSPDIEQRRERAKAERGVKDYWRTVAGKAGINREEKL